MILLLQVKSLEGRVVALQDDLFAAQDEMQAAQEKYEQVKWQIFCFQPSYTSQN